MGNPYPANITDPELGVRLDGYVDFTDPSNQPGGGGSGTVQSVTAGDASITIGGTPTQNPTVEVTPLGITAAKIANATITDTQVAAANKDGASGTPSMRTLGTGAAQACAGNDSRLSNSRTPTGSAGGDLTGTYPNPTLAAFGGGAAGPIGGATVAPIITIDAKGRVSALSSATITGVAPGGTASGDLSGSYPGPTVAKVNGVSVTGTPSANQVIVATGSSAASWNAVPSPVEVTDGTHTVTAVTEIDFTSGATVSSGGTGIANVAVSGGGSGGLVKLYDSGPIGSAQSTIDTGASGVAGGHADLLIMFQGAFSAAINQGNFLLQFNADTGSNYDFVFARNNAGTIASQSSFGAATGTSPGPLPGSTVGGSYPGTCFISIPGYTGTTFWKTGTGTAGTLDNAGSHYITLFSTIGWRSTSAITQIAALTNGNGNFIAGSRMVIYGCQ